MLFIILKKVNPETLVGVISLKDESMNIKYFNNDVKEMIDPMQPIYEDIITNNQTHNDIFLHVFRALKTCTNQEFIDALQTKKMLGRKASATRSIR